MKEQFLDAYKKPYNLREVPLPEVINSHDLLIKVDAASYCHTDAVLAEGLMVSNPRSFPHVGSHEFAGTVVSAHPQATDLAKSFTKGSRVGVPGRSNHPCETCFECLDASDGDPEGYSVYCASPDVDNNGISSDGGFRQYAVVDSRQIAPIPDGMTAVETAPLMCAGITIYAAIKKAGLKPGQRLGIVGAGVGLGHLGLQFANKMGLKVTGVDAADKALELARGLSTGAQIVHARSEDVETIVQQIGAEDKKTSRLDMGLDAVIILPESQKAFDYGVNLLRNHGKCVVVSFPEKGFNISSKDIVFRQIDFFGSLVGSIHQTREMLKFAAENGVKAVTKSYPLSKLNDLVEDYHKGSGGKLVVDMSLL